MQKRTRAESALSESKPGLSQIAGLVSAPLPSPLNLKSGVRMHYGLVDKANSAYTQQMTTHQYNQSFTRSFTTAAIHDIRATLRTNVDGSGS